MEVFKSQQLDPDHRADLVLRPRNRTHDPKQTEGDVQLTKTKQNKQLFSLIGRNNTRKKKKKKKKRGVLKVRKSLH
ncbi:hypothetical protein VZT92_020281 [Zoarces viviparus]|uniref:Uncharacterized protein n=1 Tax=Zoarces viviparus TaxID=48416 RepID=A0AAW1EFD0_ZOAVI